MGAPRLAPGVRLAAFDSTIAATREADEAARALGLRLRMLYGEPLAGAPDTAEAASQPRRSLLGLPTDYADLTVDGQARLELRTNRTREERCTPALSLDPN